MKNEIIIKEDVCTMFLYNRSGTKSHETVFDVKFLDEVKKYNKWSSYKHRNTRQVITNLNKEQRIKYGKNKLRLHQLILPCKKPFIIDHINHNGLDNRLVNLKIVTNRQNCENKIRKNKTGFIGVHWHNRDKIWASNIQINGKNKHIGNFKTPEEASKAREEYKIKNGIK